MKRKRIIRAKLTASSDARIAPTLNMLHKVNKRLAKEPKYYYKVYGEKVYISQKEVAFYKELTMTIEVEFI